MSTALRHIWRSVIAATPRLLDMKALFTQPFSPAASRRHTTRTHTSARDTKPVLLIIAPRAGFCAVIVPVGPRAATAIDSRKYIDFEIGVSSERADGRAAEVALPGRPRPENAGRGPGRGGRLTCGTSWLEPEGSYPEKDRFAPTTLFKTPCQQTAECPQLGPGRG